MPSSTTPRPYPVPVVAPARTGQSHPVRPDRTDFVKTSLRPTSEEHDMNTPTRTASIGSMVAGLMAVTAALGAGSPAAATALASATQRIASERTITPWYAIPNEALGGLTPNAYVAQHQE